MALVVIDAVIPNGSNVTPAISLVDNLVAGIRVPTIDNGTITLEVSYNGTTWESLKDTAGAGMLAWAASTGAFHLGADAAVGTARLPLWIYLLGAPHFRIKTGVNQTADRTFSVFMVGAGPAWASERIGRWR